MEAPLQIVGCVLCAKPAADLVDAFVAQLRRERAVIMVKSAQRATFVRFNAPDVKLVALACVAAGRSPTLLRFGFAAGTKEGAPAEQGLGVSTRSIAQASELAGGAADGEVLVAPQLAVLLIEAGYVVRSRAVRLPDDRTVQACSVQDAAEAARGAPRPADPPRPAGTPLPGSASATMVPAAVGAAATELPPAMRRQAVALEDLFRALTAQAQEMARRQGDLEARQDAVLGKMTLVDGGGVSSRHLAQLEAELDGQMARVEARLEFIGQLEKRVGHLQGVTADLERRLAEQLPRAAEVGNLKSLWATLVARADDARRQLDGLASMQEQLLPLAQRVSALGEGTEKAQRVLATFEARLGELDRGAETLEQTLRSLADRETLVQAVKTEVEGIRHVAERSRADLQFVSDHREEVAALSRRIEELLGRVEETDERIAGIDAQRKLVEEVQQRASTITHMLGDVNVQLEMLGERRAEIDHVGEKLARLDFMVQEAQNTLRALQREREVAERIEQGIRSLRTRSSAA